MGDARDNTRTNKWWPPEWVLTTALLPLFYWVLSFGNDVAFIVAVAIVVVLGVAILAASKVWTRETSTGLLTDNSKLARVPVIQPWMRQVAVGMLFFSITSLLVVWFFLWPKVFPVAAITRFEPAQLTWASGDMFLRHTPVIATTPDGKQHETYQSLTLTVAKYSQPNIVRIESVRVTAVPADVVKSMPVVGVVPENVTKPNKFIAQFSPGGTAVAYMHDEGKPIAGVVVLEDKSPFCELHLDLQGIDGFFYVSVEITVTDQRGNRRRVIKTRDPVLARIYAPEEPQNQPGGDGPQK